MRVRDSLLRLKRLFEVVLQSRDGYRTKAPRPYMIVVEVTRRCNARCRYCDSWQTPGSERATELTEAEHGALLRDAYKLGARMVSFTGGEPLLREDFIAIASTAHGLGFRTALNTNGYLVSAALAPELTRVLDSVTVSIDSSIGEVMAERRGSGSALERARSGLARLLEARRHPGQIRVNAVVDEENASGLEELATELRGLGVPLLLQPLHRDGIFRHYPADHVEKRSPERPGRFSAFASAKAGLSRLEARYLRPFYAGFEDHLAGRPRWFRCFAGSFAFHVTPQGDVIVCQTQRKSLGNVRERPLQKIWHSMVETRAHISSDDRACSCWLLCSTVNYLHADRVDRVLRKLHLPAVRGWWSWTKERLSGWLSHEVPADQTAGNERLKHDEDREGGDPRGSAAALKEDRKPEHVGQ
jgi:MoaA/NifB/PqqE/SkfB family radical SAM enzyme